MASKHLHNLHRNGVAHPGMHVYPCPFGRHWHVGTRPRRFARSRRK